MHWFDTTLLALLAMSALLGAWFGLVGQLARLVCVSLSCYLAIQFHEPMANFLQDSVLKEASQLLIDIVAYSVVSVIAYLILYYAARLVRQAVRQTDLDGYDRMLGALLGAGKMSVLLGLVCLGMINYRHPTTEAILEKSQLAELFADGMERIVVMIPEEFKTRLRETVFELRDQVMSGKSEDLAPRRKDAKN
jgi:uncharacterized membrane protein required for colicin V production